MQLRTILLIVIVCITFSGIELSINEQLEDSSGQLIEWLQSFNYPTIQYIFSWIGEITSICFLVLSGSLYLSYDRNEGFLCVISAYLGAGISGVLKLIFTHPRPI